MKFNILVVFEGLLQLSPPSLTFPFLTHEFAAHLMSSAWEWWVELVLCFLLYKQNQNNFLYTTINIYKKKNHQKKHVLFVVNQTKKIQKSITPWEKIQKTMMRYCIKKWSSKYSSLYYSLCNASHHHLFLSDVFEEKWK